AKQSIWGTGDVVAGAFGNVGLIVLAIAICMGIFTGLNGFYVSASRLLFAMARAKILPDVFGKLHSTYRTPYAGIIFTMVICLAAPWFGRQVLLWIVDMASIGVAVAYFYTCFAAYKFFKWSGEDSAMEGAVSPGKKFCSLLGVISSLSFVVLLAVPGSPAFMGVPSWIALIVWLAIGVVFYMVYGKSYKQIPKNKLDYTFLANIAIWQMGFVTRGQLIQTRK
ncbi:MAG TPA: amino acid permease, partial [Pseudobacillus sp.]